MQKAILSSFIRVGLYLAVMAVVIAIAIKFMAGTSDAQDCWWIEIAGGGRWFCW